MNCLSNFQIRQDLYKLKLLKYRVPKFSNYPYALQGEGFRVLTKGDCENIFFDKMEEVCPPGKEPGCLEVTYRMSVALDRVHPGGEEDPNQCYQESCVAKYLKREFGDIMALEKKR